jgi:hypothetical protein
MPLRIELRTERGEAVRGVDDPSGGTFDAAGDFDRVLTQTGELLRYVDPYGDTVFNTMQAADLVGEVEQIMTMPDLTTIERRGLGRLKVMAERCRDGEHLYLWFIGD